MSSTSRKAEHVAVALDSSVERNGGPGWPEIELVHDALPELDAEEVDLSVDLLGHTLKMPLVIAGMTGGYPGATDLNARLAQAAEEHGLAIGVGSQRTALSDPSTIPSYTVVREHAPTAFVIGNIGASQLVPQADKPALTADDLHRLVDMVRADALAIHLNFLEEAIQPEGDSRTRGCAAAIAQAVDTLDVPVIIKETGAGMARATADRLRDLGVAALDVGGAGGTSFAIVERIRAERQGAEERIALGRALGEWGTPTAAAVAATAPAGLPIIATGGVRSGLDAAKALTLGATAVGVARPLLQAVVAGDDAVDDWIRQFRLELRTVLLLTGAANAAELRSKPYVAHGQIRDWLRTLTVEPR